MPSALHGSGKSSSEEAHPLIDDTEENVLIKISHEEKQCAREFYCFLLSFFTFVLCILVICLFVTVRRNESQCKNQYNYESGYDTEFFPARQAISLKKVRFTGGPYYDYNGTLHVSSNPDEPIYTGPPSEDIDNAWEDLVHGRYLAITPDEAKEVSGNFWLNQEDKSYHAGMDVLHTLHCLNMLRMSQDLKHYTKKGNIESGRNGRIHIDHCINHLRQIVQCHGDMTPLPVVWVDIKGWPNGGREIPEFDRVHTCRDFTALRDWSTEHDQMVRQQSVEGGEDTM